MIGLELACAYAAFGTKITAAEALTKIGVQHMKKMGIEFHLECALCSR